MMSHPIPEAALSQHIAILGKTGSGKTYAAKGVVENILREGGRVCVIDPTGAWHGLRSSATGKSGGFPVVIFGGAHADLPLGGAHGEAMAEIIGTSSTPAIIDTSLMRVGERTRFFADFADALVRKNKGPLHLVIDEAHLFAPQGKVNDPQSGAMLHAANNLVSLGRSRGLRIILITQRPAKLHKDSLTQVETLVALRLIAPQDRKAVEEWIKDNADEKKGREIIESLAKLPTGTGWVWAPELDILERVSFPKIKTFDTSRAPDDGEAGSGPVLAPIDRETIEKRLQTVAADAIANDPKALKAEVAKLKRELAAKPMPGANPGIDPKAVEAAYQTGLAEGLARGENRAKAALVAVESRLKDALAVAGASLEALDSPMPAPLPRRQVTAPPVKPRPAVTNGHARPAPADGLTMPQRRVMMSLAFWKSIGHDAPTREQVAAVAGYRPGSGNFNNIVGGLTTAGQTMVPQPGCLALAVEFEGLTLPEATEKLWSVFDNPQKRLVEAAKNADGDLTREELATDAGYAPGSGNFNNIAGRLTSMDVLTRTGSGRLALSGWAREVLA
jgi:hypothetical protein